MKEVGIDISRNPVKDVFSLLNQGKSFDLVITVCDEGNSNRCPVFPGEGKRIAWIFDDPSQFSGTYEEKIAKTRKVRDQIRDKIHRLISGSHF
jgi:arsenate reductase